MRQRRLFRRFAAMTLALSIVLTACTDGDGDGDDAAAAAPGAAEGSTEPSEPEETTAPEPSEAPIDGPVVVGLTDFAFVDLPAAVPSGTRFTVENLSEREVHEFVAIKLPDDEQRPVGEIVALPADEFRDFFRMARVVLVQAPGSDEIIRSMATGRVTEAGRYMVICTVPTGVDPDEYIEATRRTQGKPNVEGGPPHYENGMWGEFEVTEG